jgi:hypothetical protein
VNRLAAPSAFELPLLHLLISSFTYSLATGLYLRVPVFVEELFVAERFEVDVERFAAFRAAVWLVLPLAVAIMV